MMELVLSFGLPVICGILAFLYWRRASIGLEDHLKHVAMGFFVLAVFELFGLAGLFRETSNVRLFKLVEPFGLINILQYLILCAAILILAKWTWYYLLKRLQTQLFMLAMTGAVGLSLLITGLFVTLLLRSIESESLVKLGSNAKVIESLLGEKRARLGSETKLFAQDPLVIQAIESSERKGLGTKVAAVMSQTDVSSLVILDKQAKIVLKGENEEERGVSWSDDKYVIRALSGESVSGIISRPGVMAPEISIRVAVPVAGGVVSSSQVLDNAFVDGLKSRTGLAVSIYGDRLLSATTEDIGDNKTRLTGIKENNTEVLEKVWKKGELLAVATRLGDSDYLSAYIPLRDQNNEISGVMQVSEPQVQALQTAGQAVQLTFAVVILVMLLLSLPIYFVCQKLVAEWE